MKITSNDLPLLNGVKVSEASGVYVSQDWSPSYVTDQFLDNADIYHQRYFNRLDFSSLIDRILTLGCINRDLPLKVLDIGSGGGSSVFAALKLLPESEVWASDISPQLLTQFAKFVQNRTEFKNRTKAFCFDLHNPFFREETFDIVIGCAILHHLVNPFEALKHVSSAIKPGGIVVLCEPIEAGNLINLFLYDSVCELEEQHGSPPNERLIRLMKAMRQDIIARLGPGAEKPWTKALDDKWIFDNNYLSNLAKDLGFSSSKVFPAQENLDIVFKTSFNSLLADSGNNDIVLPAYIVDFLDSIDKSISHELKQKLCPTGIIVFSK